MSTSQAREINNNKELTTLCLRNVSRKECWTLVYGVGNSSLIKWYVLVTGVFEAGAKHKADDIEE